MKPQNTKLKKPISLDGQWRGDQQVQEPAVPKPSGSSSERVSTVSLRNGMKLTQDIFDSSGILLLAAGMVVTPRFLSLLNRRQIRFVTLGARHIPQAVETLQTAYTRQLDELLAHELQIPSPAVPYGARRRPKLALRNMLAEAKRGMGKHALASERLQDTVVSLEHRERLPGAEMHAVVKDFADMVSLDVDLLAMTMSMQEPKNEYLFDHCVNGSLLSMTIAAYLGWPREQVVDIGFGALVQDVGMLRVSNEIRFAPRPLTQLERLDIESHPIHTLDYLEGIDGLSSAAKFIGYQVHERYDRSGYPRRRSGAFIHLYAKIVAIADTYAAMTRPRPYRPPMPPYEAAKAIVLEAGKGRFDREYVRAFLDCLSLFPIGSWVQLNNGTIAKVVRANPGMHTRPVVAVPDECGEPTDTVIDLSRESRLEIAGALRQSEALRELNKTVVIASA